MEPKEYIDRFRMNQENYEFSRQEFIAQLKFDFLESIKNHPEYNEKTGFLHYKHFRALVKEIEAKYYAISALKIMPLSKGLWGTFYRVVVVPYRANKYPDVQRFITSCKENSE